MSIIELTLLSIVQGLSEFLPISSSAHLVFFADFLKKEITIQFVIMAHIGSLLAIIAYFFNDILLIIKQKRRIIILIIVATIPAAVIGLLFKKYVEVSFSSSNVAASLLMITGFYLFLSDRKATGSEIVERTSVLKALTVGIAQAFALLPGLSRSGLTICTGLFCGWDRTDAMRFSFLMAIPAIIGASFLEFVQPSTQLTIDISSAYIILISFIFSMLALFVLKAILLQKKLIIFAIYCLLVGAFMIVHSMRLLYVQ